MIHSVCPGAQVLILGDVKVKLIYKVIRRNKGGREEDRMGRKGRGRREVGRLWREKHSLLTPATHPLCLSGVLVCTVEGKHTSLKPLLLGGCSLALSRKYLGAT